MINYNWENKDDWYELVCKKCNKSIGAYQEDFTDGAGVTAVLCEQCFSEIKAE